MALTNAYLRKIPADIVTVSARVVNVPNTAARLALTYADINEADIAMEVGVAEITKITCPGSTYAPASAAVTEFTFLPDVAGSLAGAEFYFMNLTTELYSVVWFKVSGVGSQPDYGIEPDDGIHYVEVNFTNNSSAATIAAAVAAALNPETGISASATGDAVTVTQDVTGPLNGEAYDGFVIPTGVTIDFLVPGADESHTRNNSTITLYNSDNEAVIFGMSLAGNVGDVAITLPTETLTDDALALLTKIAIDDHAYFGASVFEDEVTVTNVGVGAATDAAVTSGFTKTILTQGENPGSSYTLLDIDNITSEDGWQRIYKDEDIVPSVRILHSNGGHTDYAPVADTDAARGTALWNASVALARGETLLVGPGTFLLPARIWKNAALGDFSRQKIQGAGMDITIIKLGDMGLGDPRNSDRVIAWYSNDAPTDFVEICDLTVDCNLHGQSLSNSSQAAINLFGSHCAIRRVRAINWGVKPGGAENFVLGISAAGKIGNIYNSVIEDCIVDEPAPCDHHSIQGMQPFIVATGAHPSAYAAAPPVWAAISSTSSSDGGTTTTINTATPHGLVSPYGCSIRGHSALNLNGQHLLTTCAARPTPVVLTIIDSDTFKLSIPYVAGSSGHVICEANWGFGAKILNCKAINVSNSRGPIFMHGASIINVDGGEIAGCYFINQTANGSGIYQDSGTCYNVRIHHNFILNCSDPIRFHGNATIKGLYIENNTIISTTYSNINTSAIEVSGLAGSSDLIIRHNRMYGASPNVEAYAVYGISVYSFSNVVLEDNIIDNCTTPVSFVNCDNSMQRGNVSSAGVPVGLPEPPESDVFLRAVTNVGGTVSASMRLAVRALVSGLQSTGLWEKFIAFYPFVGGIAASHSLNLINSTRNRIQWLGTTPPTHGANGVTGNGTGYGDTRIIPLYSENWAKVSAHGSIYVYTAGTTGAYFGATPANYAVMAVSGTSIYAGLNGNQHEYTTVGTSKKLLLLSRIDDTTLHFYKDGSDSTSTPTIAAPENGPISLLARCTALTGTIDLFSNATISAATFGSGLSSTDAGNLKTLLDTFQTAMGRATP